MMCDVGLHPQKCVSLQKWYFIQKRTLPNLLLDNKATIQNYAGHMQVTTINPNALEKNCIRKTKIVEIQLRKPKSSVKGVRSSCQNFEIFRFGAGKREFLK